MAQDPTPSSSDPPKRPRGRPRRDRSLPPGDPGVLAGPSAETFARAILHSLPAHIAVLETDGRIVGVNKAWEVFVRDHAAVVPRAPRLGQNYLDALEDGRAFEHAVGRAVFEGLRSVLDRGRARFEIEYPFVADGETRWYHLVASPLLGAEGGAVVAHFDVTDRKKAEREAHEKHEVLRAVLDSSAAGVVIADRDGMFRLFNQAAREIAGVGVIESAPERWNQDFGIFHEDKVTLFRPDEVPLARAMRGESCDDVLMYIKNTSVDQPRMLSVSGRPWKTSDGEKSGGVVVFRDVTFEQTAEARMRFQAGVLDKVPNAVMALDAEGLVVYWNRACEQLMGWKAADMIGRRGRDVLLSADEHAQVDGIRRYLEGGGIYRGEFPARRPDGSHVAVLALASALRDASGALTGFVVVGVDLSDLRSTEDAMRTRENDLRQFQKMEAIGRLAGGVAHDFNNLLTVIRGYMDLVLAQLKDSDPAKKDAREVAHAADRAAELTGQLLAFSRHRPLRAVPLKLNEVVTEFLPMLKRTLGEDIKVSARLADDLGMVRGDAGQIGQVLLNLSLNARDAMPRGGELILATDNAELDASYPGTHVPLPPGPYVRLSVTDTGVGMDEETKARVFEPFFTTKGVGSGTGLGLSTAYGIVRQHDGAIWLYSEPGHGTTARIYLPRVFESFEAPATPADAAHLGGTGRTVLVVEDEAAVRQVERRMLEAQGYHVLLADSGEAALQIVRAHAGDIDLLLTDVIMPEMNGREVAAAVLALRPDLPVLFVSGHVGDALDRHGGLAPGARVLNKPFSTRELGEAVQAAIESRP